MPRLPSAEMIRRDRQESPLSRANPASSSEDESSSTRGRRLVQSRYSHPPYSNERRSPMTAPMLVTHSTPSSEAVLALMSQEYDVGVLVECTLWNTVPHDTYLVTAQDRRYFLKLYRGGPLKHTE